MATQSGSPGLVIPSPYDPLPGMDPNATMLSAMSRGDIPRNILLTNNLLGKVPAGGRSPIEAMARAGEVGTAGTVGGAGGNAFHPMSNSANGGSGPGAGGMNQDIGQNSGQSSCLDGAMPTSVIATATPPQFCG
jgi:hypothetical protein